jgi:NodT family efflux transporter outer membrane factor (OMF) lipoprotein
MILAGCKVGPNYRHPADLAAPAVVLYEVPGNPNVSSAPVPTQWWRLFDDPVLARLVERALQHNTDIRSAAANLQRARALLAEAGAARLPISDASAQMSHSRSSSSPAALLTGKPVTGDFYSAGFDASYELDLFGGVARSIEAARGDVGAAAAQLDAARVSVAAETARTYAQLCGYAVQAKVAQETATLQQQTLGLTRRLFQGGRGTERDVAQAEVLLEQAQAQVPTFEAERRASLYALAVLTGDPPAEADQAAAGCQTPPAARVALPVGDGRGLLARRPDVRAAERQLAADTARIGVATAELFPTITLLGSVSLGGTRLGDLGKSKSLSYSVGPLISWNIPFNGAARSRVRQSRAVASGSLAGFDKAVLTALRETEQALARLSGAVDREAALGRAAQAADDAARLSHLRFDYGSDNFLQLLDAERSRAAARAEYAQAEVDRAVAQVSLFKALGGGWEQAPAVEDKPLPTTAKP